MTKKIQQLSSGVVKKLRSGIAFTNVAHCVEELVLNSIDARANCIAVHLNLPFYRIQVIDNGHGIDVQQMKLIGTRYATSKCHTLNDLQNLRSGGFRGEALASLKEISSILMIESRTASSNETYCKIFTQGKAVDPKKSLNSRPSKGTTVSVYDFMYNMPVRKNSISEVLDLEECRRLLQSIALMHPNISFTLKNEVTGEMSLQLKKCSSLHYSFLQMFGKGIASNLKNIDYKKDEYEVNGYVSTVCHISKELQFLYINKRRVLKTKLHKLINSILNKALSSRQKSNNNSLTPDSSSPSKNYSMCIFVINISCPYDKYDIIFEPRKTMIEFSDWPIVLKIVEDSLIDFLKKENLYSSGNESETGLFNADLGINHNYLNFDVQDCKQGLFSNAVHRRVTVPEVVNPHNDNTKISLKNSDNSCISITTRSDEFIPNVNKKTDVHTESDFVSSKKMTKLHVQEPYLYSDSFVSSVSTLNTLKSGSEQNFAINDNGMKKISNSKEELGIPCRSVFPSGSPIMLHVPVKSTLSDLETGTSSSNFLKLKDKFKFLPKKVKIYQSSNSKLDKRQEKVCPKTNNKSNSLCVKNSPSNHLRLDLNKEKPETTKCSKGNLNNKSSQCSSVLLGADQVEHLNSTKDSEREDGLGVKVTKDKTFQCPSVTIGGKARNVSRFTFEKEPSKLPLQGLRLSNRLERKNLRKVWDKDVTPATDDLLHYLNNDIEMSSTKKLKQSPSENSMIDINNTTELVEDNMMDIENQSYVRINSEVDLLSKFYDVPNTGESSENMSINSTPEASAICKIKETKSTSFNELHCSTFNLHAFTSEKVIKNSKYISADTFHVFGKDKYNGYTDTVTHNHEVQNFVSPNTIAADFENLKSMNEQENGAMDVGSNNSLKHSSSKDLFSVNEQEMSEENKCSENSELQTQKDDDLGMDVTSEQEGIKLTCTNEGMHDVSTNIALADKGILNDDIFNSHSDSSNNPDLSNSKNKNLKESDKIIENSRTESPSLVSQSQDTLEKKSHFFKSNSSVFDVKSCCDINLESYPFTECLPSISDGCSLNKNNSEQSDECLSNCISKELFTEPPTEGRVNVDDESLDKDKKLSNSSLEEQQHNACDKTENIDVQQNHIYNNIEKENLINCTLDCSGKNDIILPICPNSDEVVFNESHAENLCTKKSEDPQNRWKQYSEPKNQRKIYIDTITGNSTYSDPEQQKVQENQNIETNNDNSLENMLNDWDNPMFNIPFEMSSITENKCPQNVSQMVSFLNSYRFSKNTLSSLQVIGQVDCKFIACILKNFNESCKDQKLLALFDQHAVHERIRLEEFIEDLYETSQDGEKSVKSVALSSPLEVQFNEEEIRLLHTYHKKLRQIGIHMNVSSESNSCSVHSVPICLVHKGTQELRRSISDSISVLQNSVKEWLTSLLKTRSIPQVLPKTLLSVLKYWACRGAVKFGDPLSLEQCRNLLNSLSECKLPFQCAHGRPSVAPILDLKKVEALYKKDQI